MGGAERAYDSEHVVLLVHGEISACDEDLVDVLTLQIRRLHLLWRHILALFSENRTTLESVYECMSVCVYERL